MRQVDTGEMEAFLSVYREAVVHLVPFRVQVEFIVEASFPSVWNEKPQYRHCTGSNEKGTEEEELSLTWDLHPAQKGCIPLGMRAAGLVEMGMERSMHVLTFNISFLLQCRELWLAW